MARTKRVRRGWRMATTAAVCLSLLALTPSGCSEDGVDKCADDPASCLDLHDAETTLRKATLLLVGRLPTPTEVGRAQAGGDAELAVMLDQMMRERAFDTFVHETYNDVLLTDRYLTNATDQLPDTFTERLWFQTAPKTVYQQYGLIDDSELERFVDAGIARQAIGLIQHVVRLNRPFTEIVTADYFMVTPLTAQSYGVTDATFVDANNPFEYAEAKLPDYPHAGVLSDVIVLLRHSTSDTNVNRSRANKIFRWFLDTDLLQPATVLDQPGIKVKNPVMDEPTCTACHELLDPVAGLFQAFDSQGAFDDKAVWDENMKLLPPGFGDEELPSGQGSTALQWLGQRIATHPGFPKATVKTIFRSLIGKEPLRPPADPSDPAFEVKRLAFKSQDEMLTGIANDFELNGYNFKVAVRQMVLSPLFRAANALRLDATAQTRLGELGMGTLLTPERLDRKIRAVMGFPWGASRLDPYLGHRERDPGSLGANQLMFGGIDSTSVATRLRSPSALPVAIAQRMAMQMSCKAVPYDFTRPSEERRLFPLVPVDDGTMTTEQDPVNFDPETEAGVPVEVVQAAIRTAIAHLHGRILGEKVTPDHPEVAASFELFLATWREGIEKMADEDMPLSTQLQGACRAESDPYSGKPLPPEQRIVDDPRYIIRSFMAVTAYLLGSYHFIHE